MLTGKKGYEKGHGDETVATTDTNLSCLPAGNCYWATVSSAEALMEDLQKVDWCVGENDMNISG